MTEAARLEALLDAILGHVPFDGWSETAFSAALIDAGLSEEEGRAIAPRRALDLAIAYHRRGDRKMLELLDKADLTTLRYSERVAQAIKFRIDVMEDREAIRRATTLFSLPGFAPEGTKLIWETSDHIWKALGDTSEDGNWYSKRAILSAVWGSVVLYWLGDDSPGYAKTYDFVDRRIENVMQFEKIKSDLRSNPLTKPVMEFQDALFARFKAPSNANDLPGRWSDSG